MKSKKGGRGGRSAARSSIPRLPRVNRAIKNELAELLPGVRDPGVAAAAFMSVTEVRASADLSVARVFVSVPGEPDWQGQAIAGLQRAQGYLRGELARRLRIRKVPELHFELDESLQRAARLDDVLGELEAERRREVDVVEVVEVLRGAERVLVTSHPSPDGDAIGSIVAAYWALVGEGKQVTAYNPDLVPDVFRFLEGTELIGSELPEGPFDVTLVLDCADARMFPGGVPPAAELTGTVLVVDHHRTDGDLGQLVYRDPAAASVGVMLHRIFGEMGCELSPKIAEALYTSVLSDTGSFRYQNTDPEALRVAADLVAHGVDPWRVASNLYESRPREQLELLAAGLCTPRVSDDGLAAALTVTPAMLAQTGCTPDMVDGFVNFARGLRGVEVAMLLRPSDSAERIRVSMRSRGGVDVSAIAAALGGGGHRNAAGCTVEGEALEPLIDRLFVEVSRRAREEADG